MDRAKERVEARKRIKTRIRKKVTGTSERPRLAVFRSLKHMYAQIIDDVSGVTLVTASSREEVAREGAGKVGQSVSVGKLLAQRAKEKGLAKVAFDRGGYLYHGRVKALADGARAAGLEF